MDTYIAWYVAIAIVYKRLLKVYGKSTKKKKYNIHCRLKKKSEEEKPNGFFYKKHVY